ncbi:MAG: DNA topoisomerase IV subunit A [Alphaproteobacteria bacterium]|nr:DNA topoisomerase IV subunit A [Alphaproteobacteria bacterium]
MAKKPVQTEEIILDVPLTEALSERYLSYALSTIMSRSLPDVRDGLKPVHRRVLYAMYQLKLNPNQSPKKCARVVGDVIGKFHPHGDQSVYDALVRLAQDFSVRYPLVDGQGNFGNIDGDNAAAMRYTESRMTSTAIRLLDGIDQDSVDFRETYDGETQEPIVLPANFPNLLANGSTGIAVGMATNIPPHNVYELCDAMLLILAGDPSVRDLMQVVTGPDFPTGGTLVESEDTIIKAYETGRGSFRLRAKWEKEELGQGQYQIIVTEIPYQVQKSKLIERIADLIISKKIPILDDVIDESAEDIRVVLVPKTRNVEAEILMEALFRNCDLENRFAMNMNALDGGLVPKVMNLKEILQSFLKHRQHVLVRQTHFRLEKVLHRLDVLAGYLIVFLNIDEVIRIIRFEDDPKASMMEIFKLNENQAEAILNMRLRSLRKLEEMEMRTEHDALSKERDALQALIKSEAKQWTMIKKQIIGMQKDYGLDTELGARRTVIGKPPGLIEVDLDQIMIEKESISVVLSSKGWIKAMKGHGAVPKDIKYKDGDKHGHVLEAYTTDKILIFATNGRFYTLGGDKLPSGRGFGDPVRLVVDLPNEADIVDILVYKPEEKFLVASSDGRGFVVKSEDLLAQTKTGKQILNVSGNVEALLCVKICDDADYVATIGQNRKILTFPLNEVPEMGRGKGVTLQKYKDGGISDLKTFVLEDGLSYKYGTGETVVEDLMPWLGKRAQAGRMPPNGFPRNNKF